MPGEQRVALELEVGDVGGEAHAEPGGHPGREIAALGRGGEERGAVAAALLIRSAAVAANTSGL